MNSWLLKGLDGGNPLAFLAALGTLRTAALARPDYRCHMTWREAEGGWRPELSVETEEKLDLVADLTATLACMRNHKAFMFADDLSITFDQFATVAKEACDNATTAERKFVDFLAAFGSDVPGKDDKMSSTAFKLLGGGQTSFLGSIRTFVRDTEAEHLSKALLEPWRYDDPMSKGHTMFWDFRDDVRRALRWNEPSGDPARDKQGSVWGANRLAIEGLPLLPTGPVGSQLETTGFTLRKGNGMFWTWPIWETDASLDVVRSLLALSDLRREQPDRRKLSALGIREIYRCQRIPRGNYKNFTPAQPV